MRTKFLTLFSLLALAFCAGSAHGQSAGRMPPPDLLPMIQMTQAIVSELKAACSARYPELKDEIERAHKEWILYPVRISVQVNGKDYVSPTVSSMVDRVKSDFASQAEERSRRDCEDFRKGLNRMLESVPKEMLSPFLAEHK